MKKYLDQNGLEYLVGKLDTRYSSGSGISKTLLGSDDPITQVIGYDSYYMSGAGVTCSAMLNYKLILIQLVTGIGVLANVIFDPNRVLGDGVTVGFNSDWWQIVFYENYPIAINIGGNNQYLYAYDIYGIN